MSPENTPNTTKICPTCGTRLNINATRCSVCGSNLAPSVAVSNANAVRGPRIPEVTLSLPVVFGLAILLLVIGAGIVYAVLEATKDKDTAVGAVAITETATVTATATLEVTPTEESTPTLVPTWTLEPPLLYKVADGDMCSSLAYAFGVDAQSIIVLNGLTSSCELTVGKEIKIPRPTPTASPAPTNTPNATQEAEAECNKVDYIVKDGDTMGGITANYAVSAEAIRSYNGKNSDVVFAGEKLVIPLCEQTLVTPTPTVIPPYQAPNLLLPADGASNTNPTDIITLQWASVGTLRQNEAYAVTIENVTEGNARKLVEYVTDTKFIVPETFRPASTAPHVFRWTVLTVRQTGTDKDTGNPVWEPAGSVSAPRTFVWVGTNTAPEPEQPTETPAP